MGADARQSDLGWLRELRRELTSALEAAGPHKLAPAAVAALSESVAQVDRALEEKLRQAGERGAPPPHSQAGGEQPESVTDRDSFVRMKEFLLSHYRDMFVAFAGGRVVAASRCLDELFDKLDAMDSSIEVCVERVDERAFQGPAHHVMTGVEEAREVTRTP